MKRTTLLGAALGGLLLFILCGCNQATIMKRMTPKEDEAISRKYVDELRHDRFDDIEQDMDPGLKESSLRSKLISMAAMFPAQEPISSKVVGFRTSTGPVHRTEVTLEYEFPDKWLLASVVTEKNGGGRTIVGFHVTPIEDSLENVNRFTLVNKGASQYGVLLLAILAPVLSLYSLLRCIMADMGKKKWLWLIFILLGVGKLSVNWTTGQLFFMLLAIQAPVSGANTQLYGPWFVYVSLPLGAIIFLAAHQDSQKEFKDPLAKSAQAGAGAAKNPFSE